MQARQSCCSNKRSSSQFLSLYPPFSTTGKALSLPSLEITLHATRCTRLIWERLDSVCGVHYPHLIPSSLSLHASTYKSTHARASKQVHRQAFRWYFCVCLAHLFTNEITMRMLEVSLRDICATTTQRCAAHWQFVVANTCAEYPHIQTKLMRYLLLSSSVF